MLLRLLLLVLARQWRLSVLLLLLLLLLRISVLLLLFHGVLSDVLLQLTVDRGSHLCG